MKSCVLEKLRMQIYQYGPIPGYAILPNYHGSFAYQSKLKERIIG